MCGIVGFLGPWDKKTLERITALLRHRGPDDVGYHFSSRGSTSVGLGHRRLSIIDLNKGHQPIWNEDRTKLIIFNGEIYNYRLLRLSLEALGHVFTTQSDTEVVLHGFEEYGPEVVERLEGMFAFAVWDEKSGRLFIARDRLGIKPLYYFHGQGVFAFGSEIKAILPLLNGRYINRQALYHYLLFGFMMQGETIFEGIFHLPPAHYLIWDNGLLTTKRYWRIEKQPFATQSEEEWAERIRSSLYAAVESHLVADVPVGITLSGGIDSSSILAFMSQATHQTRINSFTVGYNRPDDEISFSRIAASLFNIRVHERRFALGEIADHFRKIIYHLEEPVAHAGIGTTYFLSKTISEHLKVVLIGEGSDELFAGYPPYRLFMFPYSLAPRRLIHKYFFKVDYVMPGLREIENLLHPDWLDRSLLEEVSHMYAPYFAYGQFAENCLRYQLETELVGKQLLRIDKLMMAHSVEARVPFLDRAFAELAFSVPFPFKVKGGIEKYILRRTLEPLLPREVVYRPKSGKKGTQSLKHPLLEEGLLPGFRHLITAESIEKRGIFKGDGLSEYLDWPLSRWEKHHPIRSRLKAKFILAILVLEIWCQIFLDGNAPD
jgi:asparagine synthase (glutamine-hydrolysing)